MPGQVFGRFPAILKLCGQAGLWAGTLILGFTLVAESVSAQAPNLKTDTIFVQRGSAVIGEIKGLQDGKLQLVTWSMSTVYIQWTKVSTVYSDKQFEISMADGTRHFGTVVQSMAPDSVVLLVAGDSLPVATQSVVNLKRLGQTFWKEFTGSFDIGFDFSQQNRKTDLNFSTTVTHRRDLNRTQFSGNGTFGRQTDVDDITRWEGRFTYGREISKRRFYGGFLSNETNSQLDLDTRLGVGFGAGKYVTQTNRLVIAVWGGLSYTYEEFTDTSPTSSVPAFLTSSLNYFSWGSMTRELSATLTLTPILHDSRVRVNFDTNLKFELATHLYLKIGVTESYDTNPPLTDANKNDFSLTTSLGWTFG